MLHLASHTGPSWDRWALDHLDALVVDHAHCEKKAASTAINLLFRYPHHGSLLEPLSRLAREELEHFELVLGHLRRRGVPFVRLQPSPYASRLMEACRRDEPGRAVDTLLCCSMIEARSCERMQRLCGALRELGPDDPRSDPALADLYESLLASEARHHASYVDLARSLRATTEDELRSRLLQIASHEAAVVADAPLDPRLHNGPVA